ncbi:MAG TPA: cell division protein FtsW [Cryomorphaceae bacterium]|mgnify:FL=1|nr:cell division protein FtsW [Cryomorphaceae bacterium]|tara:strand:- start:668 stop:1876 length:1209 start_codon:yes stop_codon:yes gene_type:complete
MDTVRKYLKGDLLTWGLILLLMLISFLPTYSASSSLAHKFRGGNTFSFLTKHLLHLGIGSVFMYGVHRLNFRLIGKLSQLIMPVALILLVITLLQGQEMGGANASRWVRIPVIGMSFQSSAFASLALLVWLAKWFSKPRDILELKDIKWPLIMIGTTLGLILPADFSTTAIIFAMCFLMMVIAGVPWKHLWKIIAAGVAAFGLFILIVIAFPNISNRVATWQARIVNFSGGGDEDGAYQTEQAKMAIAEGEVFGKGPGKSIQKNFLPQSNSDFVFAVITEEYGLVGATLLILFYGGLFRRFVKIARRAHTKFGTLLVLAASSGIVLQTIVNMGVATSLFPVTGQTLPFFSAGGSSVWMTCIALGIILSVSHTDVERIVGTSPQEEEENRESIISNDKPLAHE